MTLNQGRFLINLRPHDQRSLSATGVIRHLQSEVAGVVGVQLFMQPVQDLSLDTAVSATQYQFVLETPNYDDFKTWVPKVVDEAPGAAAAGRRHLRPAGDRPGGHGDARPRHRCAVQHHAGNRRQRALRQLRPAPDQHHLHAVQPVPGDPGNRPVAGPQPVQPQPALPARQRLQHHDHHRRRPQADRRPGAARSGGFGEARHGAAADLPSRPVPRHHDLVQPAAGRVAGSRRSTPSSGRKSRSACPEAFQTSFQGTASAFQSSLGNELFLVLAALAAVYIVLGVLYESFVHPVTILSTLPSAGHRRAGGADAVRAPTWT